MKKLAVIGFGKRSEELLRNFNTFGLDTEIVAVLDKNPEGATARLQGAGFDASRVKFCATVEQLFGTDAIDGVVVATQCDTHTDFAVQAMQYNVPLLMEKPVAINDEQISRLHAAAQAFRAPSLVSFPLRGSYLCQLAKKMIDRGDIGKVQQVQALNNVPYARCYYKNWYRDDSLTGGLFLQKATHDLDAVNYLLTGRSPVQVCAMESKQVFQGDMPAGTKCNETCPKWHTCPESNFVLKHSYHGEEQPGDGCSFAVDTGNHDSASVMVRYDDGMHAVYTQNFVARKGASKRGVRLIGFEGTLEFDWVSGTLHVYDHKDLQVATYKIDDDNLLHYGGDKCLCENFAQLMAGNATSLAPLQDGILSAHLCLQARKSAQTSSFMPVGL